MASPSTGSASIGNSSHSRRFIFVYRYGLPALIMLGLGWALVFGLMQWWWVMLAELALAAVGVVSYMLLRGGRLATSLLVSQAAMFVIAISISLVFDTPEGDILRVSHIYLLVLAALGYMNYQRQKTAAQLVLIALCILAFIALSSAPLALPFSDPLPASVRTLGSWINSTIAVLMLCGCVYTMQAEFSRADEISRELMSALWNEEFHLVYQPQVDLSRTTIGAEALLRWTSPRRGNISPMEFIPQAERCGLMVRIGNWVLEQGCRTLAEWQRHPDFRRLTLSINVSATQLLHSDFEAQIRAILIATGADPTGLTLELTESVLVTDMDLVITKLDALHAMGITISLDDFGTGYSSLSYLRRLPIQQLKIDRGFVQDAVNSARSAALAENVIRLGRDLGQSVLAEGVETPEQHHLLARAGCVQFQGYLYGKPMTLADFERRIEDEGKPLALRSAG